MKGFFNKVTSQMKDLINTSTSKEAGFNDKTNPKPAENSSFKMFSEELTKNLQRIGFASGQKFTPKSRQEIIKNGLNSQKCFQLFQHLEEIKNEEVGANIYHKMRSKYISELFDERKDGHRDIDVTSEEILNLISSSQGQQGINHENPLLCISVIGFHHEQGTIVEHSYPNLDEDLGLNKELIEKLKSYLIDSGMPDAIHNANEDFVYFIIDINKNKVENLSDEIFQKISNDPSNNHALLYGVSYFKQIPVTEDMKKHDPDLVRSHVQKAVCVLSKIPVFGHLLAKLDPITKCYFTQDNFNETEILKNGFESMNSSLKEISANSNEIFVGTCIKKLIYFFQEKVVVLWKALFLEKRVLIYSQQPSACSTFIHSLISLFPCLCHFKYQSKTLNIIENHFNEYGLPLHLFNEESLLIPYFSVHNVDPVTSSASFLAGTSNPFIKTLPSVNWDILVDLDKNSIQFKNDALKKALALTSQDLQFAQTLIKRVKSNNKVENLSWNNTDNSIFNDTDAEFKGGEDWLRHKFYEYMMALLSEIEFFRNATSTEKLDSLITEYNDFMATTKNETKQKEEKKNWKDEVLKGEGDSDGEDEADDNLEALEIDSEESPTKLNTSNSSQEDVPGLSIQAEEKKSSEGVNKNSKDPKAVLKKELQLAKESGKTLRKFGLDWILKWTKTRNFAYWLGNHSKVIGERSINNPRVKEHFWFYENGDIYFGALAYGQRHGVGTFVDRDAKMAYVGDWEGNKRSGVGKLISIEDGKVIYEGGYKSNKKHGKGTCAKGDEKYTGMLSMNVYEGNGVLIDKENNKYEGDFKEGLKWGVGKLQWANEDLYTGEFYKGKPHGKGQLVLQNGDFYSGDFKDGMRSGKGVYQSKGGESYEGKFENNLYEGSGVLMRADGHKFKGSFKKGELEDGKEGIITYPDNKVYQGLIKNYKAHGEGVLKKGIEVLEAGRFEDGKFMKE